MSSGMIGRFALAPPVRNAASLYVLLIAGQIIPLIVLPYVLRTLGPDGYGRVAFAHSFVIYLTIVVNFGFDWSATRAIANVRTELRRVGEVASSVWLAKSVLALLCIVVGTGIGLAVPLVRQNIVLVFLLYTEVIQEVLNPKWAFRGFEQMGYLPVITIAFRMLEVVAILLLVRSSSDLYMYAWIIGTRAILVGATSALVAITIFKLHLSLVPLSDVFQRLRGGALLFLSSSSEQTMRNSGTFILGLIAGPGAVGIYRPVEQVVRAGVRLLDPLSQAVYPWLARMAKDTQSRFRLWSRRLVAINAGLGLLMGAAILTISVVGISILFGGPDRTATLVMMVFAMLPIMVAASKATGIQILLPLGLDRGFAFAQVTGLGALLVCGVVLVPGAAVPAVAMAASVVIAEGTIALVCMLEARRALAAE